MSQTEFAVYLKGFIFDILFFFNLSMCSCYALPTDQLSVKQCGQHKLFGFSVDKLWIFCGRHSLFLLLVSVGG